ncbi:hypothetical protein SAMN05216410_1116 [Sanguibacter gelidistatuariae]|uniref:Sigma-70 family RNA polymerase sigma factor n=1 Tax=Sanguibacter gelidistatuariae TaxID=1814289 RepID=A0A1G6HL02_9MICO|nr:sigma-70 family RNA polymerase sigma factor [Sanguibacter gelidistatuariae]SDB94864.1 hypothetical protein SAMN05216410_1116 [Sanguibacter gelidistatuariae]
MERAGVGSTQQSPAEVVISDSYLVEQVRDGNLDAYLELWDRHVESARAVASTADVDDGEVESVVNRAFSRVLGQITINLDPLGPFRPYLFHMLQEEFGVRERAALPLTNVLRAFRRLPVRVQTVLWYSVVEELETLEVATLTGEKVEDLTPLLIQSIDHLRAEWLVELICDPTISDTCAWLVQRTDARVRGELGQISADRFDRHLTDCEVCAEFLASLETFPDVLRHAFLPLFIVNGLTGSAADL